MSSFARQHGSTGAHRGPLHASGWRDKGKAGLSTAGREAYLLRLIKNRTTRGYRGQGAGLAVRSFPSPVIPALAVIPAKAGIQSVEELRAARAALEALGPRLRGGDGPLARMRAGHPVRQAIRPRRRMPATLATSPENFFRGQACGPLPHNPRLVHSRACARRVVPAGATAPKHTCPQCFRRRKCLSPKVEKRLVHSGAAGLATTTIKK